MEKVIKSVKLLACGSCENNLGIVFKGHKKEKRHFPAMVGLIEHKDLGYILYDTGYSELIFKNGLVSFLYNLLNKATVPEDVIITNQLEKSGISISDIRTIILSHGHPDHIGALPKFSNYKLISTKEVFDTMKKPKLFDLVFKNMKPDSDINTVEVNKNIISDSFLNNYFSGVYDVLGDGSIIGIKLDGHAKGQLGLFLPEYNIMLCSDSCWGNDLLELVPNMRFIPQQIQNDFDQYKRTVESLIKLRNEHPEIKMIFSHQIGGFL